MRKDAVLVVLVMNGFWLWVASVEYVQVAVPRSTKSAHIEAKRLNPHVPLYTAVSRNESDHSGLSDGGITVDAMAFSSANSSPAGIPFIVGV